MRNAILIVEERRSIREGINQALDDERLAKNRST
jgi:hypothetical protein